MHYAHASPPFIAGTTHIQQFVRVRWDIPFSQFIRLAKWQFDGSSHRRRSSIRRFVDSIPSYSFASIQYIYIYIFFSILVINSFIFHHSAFFFHGLVWLTTNGSRDFRKKFGDPPSGTLFSLRHSWRKKKKKKNGKKWTSFVPFFPCRSFEFPLS